MTSIPRKIRADIYRALTALAPLAIAYGVVSEQKAALWIAAASNLLGFGLAAANTPRTAED